MRVGSDGGRRKTGRSDCVRYRIFRERPSRTVERPIHENSSEALNQSLIHIELPAFLTASPETDAHQLARLMLAHRLNAALVINAAGQPAGVVTSTDYLKLYANAGRQEGAV